ncbi:hypothetical protein FRC19_011566 [Serendipita sp. 401]|nr:hypothetical protein FRC19_011566 [Serendipita sp. 401]KAG9058215.1 hypothetical protein FS842_000156 [Serendipita sp. 407]
MLRTAPSLELVKGQAFWVSVDLQFVPDPQLAASLMEHPFTQTCAISYLPAEILQDIFDLVLSTWLRPGDGNHLIDDLWLFHSGCVSYREYWRIERVWRSLRSTCRQWYRLLEGHTVPLATTDNLKFYIYPRPIGSPTIQRLETHNKSSCWVICNKMCDSYMMRTEHSLARQDQGLRRWNTSSDCSNMGRLQIFIHQGDCDPQTDFSTFIPIYDAPLLRALSIYTFLYSPVNPPLPSLTHLHLRGTLDALPQLQLLLLKFLHLSIERPLDSRKHSQSTPFLFHSWSLPLLVTLRLSGEIVEEEGDLVRELVLKCSQTMVNLVLDFCLLRPESSPIARTAPLSVVYPVLHLCQRLTVLGLSMSFLTHRMPIPSLSALTHIPEMILTQAEDHSRCWS